MHPMGAAVAGQALFAILATSACGAGSNAAPPAAPAPERVLTVVAEEPPPVAAGAKGTLAVVVHISGEFHIMSNDPSMPTHVPTSVEITPAPLAGITFDTPGYPPPVPFHLEGVEIRTFQGDTSMKVPFSVATDAKPGLRTLPGRVHYQACTTTRCLSPRDENFVASVRVAR